jgi:DNA-binding CsgD family transcriptional regulator
MRARAVVKNLSVAEIADLAGLATSRRAFRDEVMRRLRETVGYDGGWFHTLDPSLPLGTGCWDTLDMTCVERARAGWGDYAPRLIRLRAAMSASRGVAQDSEVYSAHQRERNPWFADIVRPLGMRHMVWTGVQLGGQDLAVVGVARADAGRSFSRASQEFLRQLAPALALAESFLQLRPSALAPGESPDSPNPEVAPALTPKEREILELFEHGASYQDVARLLQISINTVRDHVRNIYEKLHVTSKVEAVMKLRSRSTP